MDKIYINGHDYHDLCSEKFLLFLSMIPEREIGWLMSWQSHPLATLSWNNYHDRHTINTLNKYWSSIPETNYDETLILYATDIPTDVNVTPYFVASLSRAVVDNYMKADVPVKTIWVRPGARLLSASALNQFTKTGLDSEYQILLKSEKTIKINEINYEYIP